MSDDRQRLQICSHCGREKQRSVSKGMYRYRCHCLVWKVHMAVLEHARRREASRGRRRRPVLAAG